MTGSELATIRKQFGLNSEDWGLALGYGRTAESAGVSVRKLEMKHDSVIPEAVARLALMFSFLGVIPHGWTEERVVAREFPPTQSHARQREVAKAT